MSACLCKKLHPSYTSEAATTKFQESHEKKERKKKGKAVFHWAVVSCSVVDSLVGGKEPCLQQRWACLAKGSDGFSVSTLPLLCERKDSLIGTV